MSIQDIQARSCIWCTYCQALILKTLRNQYYVSDLIHFSSLRQRFYFAAKFDLILGCWFVGILFVWIEKADRGTRSLMYGCAYHVQMTFGFFYTGFWSGFRCICQLISSAVFFITLPEQNIMVPIFRLQKLVPNLSLCGFHWRSSPRYLRNAPIDPSTFFTDLTSLAQFYNSSTGWH